MDALAGIDKCMSPEQLEAHRWLDQNFIECQRQARIRPEACERYIRKYWGLARTYGCIGCIRYVKPAGARPVEFSRPMVTPAAARADGRSEIRGFQMDKSTRKDEFVIKPNVKIQKAAEERKLQRTVAAIKRGDKRFEKRKATFEAKEKERKLRLADLGQIVERILEEQSV